MVRDSRMRDKIENYKSNNRYINTTSNRTQTHMTKRGQTNLKMAKYQIGHFTRKDIEGPVNTLKNNQHHETSKKFKSNSRKHSIRTNISNDMIAYMLPNH